VSGSRAGARPKTIEEKTIFKFKAPVGDNQASQGSWGRRSVGRKEQQPYNRAPVFMSINSGLKMVITLPLEMGFHSMLCIFLALVAMLWSTMPNGSKTTA
jgi:hypothetical protein